MKYKKLEISWQAQKKQKKNKVSQRFSDYIQEILQELSKEESDFKKCEELLLKIVEA
ncbi:MAG: hypothetical protein ABGX27_07660 [Desulfurobacteriaceae bacterium]